MKINSHRVLLSAVIVALSISGPSHVFAADSTTQNVQKAVDTVKEAINDLVSAKDEKKATEAPLRVDTLKKAISLATDEAKETRIKLIGLDDLSKEYEIWRTAKVTSSKEMIDALDSFKKELSLIEKSDSDDLDNQVKSLGSKIKNWRETKYLPFATEVQNYFLIADEYKTIETAKLRAEKIEADIVKLEKRKRKTDDLKSLLQKANTAIESSTELNDQAETLFRESYLPKEKKSEVMATSAPKKDDSSSTQPKSIRDLVTESSVKVKESYKIFIEMSNLVRRLLK